MIFYQGQGRPLTGMHLYVCRGSNGLLKVGRTGNFHQRHQMLRSLFQKMGEELVKFDFTESMPFTYPDGESRLLSSLRNQGLEPVQGREWFRGGDYDSTFQTACKIREEIVCAYTVDRQALKARLKIAEETQQAEARAKAEKDRLRLLRSAKKLLPYIQAGTLFSIFPELLEQA